MHGAVCRCDERVEGVAVLHGQLFMLICGHTRVLPSPFHCLLPSSDLLRGISVFPHSLPPVIPTLRAQITAAYARATRRVCAGFLRAPASSALTMRNARICAPKTRTYSMGFQVPNTPRCVSCLLTSSLGIICHTLDILL